MVVNRTPPRVTPPTLTPTFSAQPTDKELMEARIFGEPLVPVGRGSLAEENRALADVVRRYVGAGNPELVLPFWEFLKQFPDSPWRASLLMNLGIVYRRTGYFSRALDTWESAWASTKTHNDLRAKGIADRTLGELIELHARLGRFDRLEALFTEIEGRPILGRASEQITGAREGLWLMKNRPDQAFRCGPLAIDQILAATRASYRRGDAVTQSKSTTTGTSLAQMQRLAAELELPMRMAHRSPGGQVLLPALVHWRAGHFAALIREENGRLLVRDPTFGDEIWISRMALDDEASGYMLIESTELPVRWRAVDASEGAEVWGKGQTHSSDPDNTCTVECCPRTDTCSGGLCKPPSGPGSSPPGGSPGGPASPSPGRGMPVYSAHLMLVSLNFQDTPVGYEPPRGPAIFFTVTYNQREAFQPQTFSFSHLGPKWMANWVSYVEDDPTNPSAIAYVAMRGGGRERYQNFNAGTQAYDPGRLTQAVLVRTSTNPIRYERRLSDGSVEVFAQPDGALAIPRRIFMTEVRDPSGDAVTLTYDAQLRLVALIDAVGQVTTVAYTDPADSRRITRVTDPFGRFATFGYDGNGRLAQTTDVMGLQSTFTYDSGDFIVALTTPYGVSRFLKGENGNDRWLEMVDPMGGRERVEYRTATTLPGSEPVNTVPSGPGLSFTNTWLEFRNTFYWDKRAMAVAPRDVAGAHIMHWLHATGPLNQTSGVVESERRPGEGRIWYLYPGQPNSNVEGTIRRPSVMARVLDDGTTQVSRATYNALGRLTSHTDPIGRRISFTLAANGIDVLEMRQTTGSLNDLLASYGGYTAQHQPQTITDSAGQTTTRTYNAQGQVLTETNAKNETTTYVYASNGSGHLEQVTGPMAGATTTFTYDGYGRVRTVTDSDGYTLTTDYDAFDRPTRVTYPDGSFEENIYDRLDLVETRDRLGRSTKFFYDAVQRLVTVRDPLGRVTTQQWCACGSLDAVIDAKGQKTTWERDQAGRVIRERRADGLTATVYSYEPRTSRLKTVTDPKQQVTTYTYHLDDSLASIVYANAQIATPSVTFAYDPAYERVTTMTDGVGTTTFTYHPAGSLGAGQIATVDGPLTNDVIAYGYDELGRLASRSVNAVASTTWLHDAIGRIASETNGLGTFTYTYDGLSGRPASMLYPNGQTTTYTYGGLLEDHRLATIQHSQPGGAPLSRYEYTQDRVGNIVTARQQVGSDPAVQWTYRHDGANQLVSGVLRSTSPAPVVLKRYAYAYDAAGNRTVEQVDDAATGSAYDALNRLVEQRPGGTLRFGGFLNEAAAVTIQGQPATVDVNNVFIGSATVSAGTNTVAIQATDPSGNIATATYQVDVAAGLKTLSYDANGNLASDGIRTFEWDARNQLVAVSIGSHRSEYVYDGLQRRVRVIEKEGGVTQTDTRVIWCSGQVCEERAADGTTVLRRALPQGEQTASGIRFFATDHLGSVAEVTDGGNTVLGRRAFDPWGRRTVTAGADATPVGFGGYIDSGSGGPLLTRFRAYDPDLGRWLSEDPVDDSTVEFTRAIEQGISPIDVFDDGAAEPEGYVFVQNQPLTLVDIDGLFASCTLRDQKCTAATREYKLSLRGIRYLSVCRQRLCWWRCYHADRDNCYKVPCKKRYCSLDHGVDFRTKHGPDLTKPYGAAPLCDDVRPQAKQ